MSGVLGAKHGMARWYQAESDDGSVRFANRVTAPSMDTATGEDSECRRGLNLRLERELADPSEG